MASANFYNQSKGLKQVTPRLLWNSPFKSYILCWITETILRQLFRMAQDDYMAPENDDNDHSNLDVGMSDNSLQDMMTTCNLTIWITFL